MPELPEVEVVRRGLEQQLEPQLLITKLEFFRKDLRDPIPIKKLKNLEGAKLLAVKRRAKYLIFVTDRGSMISHLGMTGTWRVGTEIELKLHDHIKITFSNRQQWVYRDPRRFGIFDYLNIKQQSPRFEHLGPEPLHDEFNAQFLKSVLVKKQTPIKVAIMDQRIVVGVGNIYASEALFRAKISPNRKALRLNMEDCEHLVTAIKQTLVQAIKAGGSSISDFKSSNESAGYFQNYFQVYDRKDLQCVICATPLKSKVLAGRSTFWCPQCQKK